MGPSIESNSSLKKPVSKSHRKYAHHLTKTQYRINFSSRFQDTEPLARKLETHTPAYLLTGPFRLVSKTSVLQLFGRTRYHL